MLNSLFQFNADASAQSLVIGKTLQGTMFESIKIKLDGISSSNTRALRWIRYTGWLVGVTSAGIGVAARVCHVFEIVFKAGLDAAAAIKSPHRLYRLKNRLLNELPLALIYLPACPVFAIYEFVVTTKGLWQDPQKFAYDKETAIALSIPSYIHVYY